MKLKRILALALTLAWLACPALSEGTRAIFAMDTAMTINASGAGTTLLEACEAEVVRLEGLLSVTRAGSEISALNAYGATALSPDTEAVLEAALELAALTDGALDVTVYPVARAWGFTTGNYRVPPEGELFRLRRNVSWKKLTLDGHEARVPEGVMVDLGALAKGYTADRLAAILRQGGVDSAILDLGGDVYCLGGRADGGDWRVGIRDPFAETGLAGILTARDEAVMTAGPADRSFTAEDGTVYGHIFDPVTGRPADSDVRSATVVGPEGLRCDGLSTALCVLGLEKATALLQRLQGFEALLIDADGGLWLTPGLKDRFTPVGDRATAEFHWIAAE